MMLKFNPAPARSVSAKLLIDDTADHIIDAKEAAHVAFTISGFDWGTNGSVVFTDANNDQVVVNINSNGTYMADLSTLISGAISSELLATDPAGNIITVSGNPVFLHADGAGSAALSVNDTADHLINATEASNVAFSVSGLDAGAGTRQHQA